MIERFDILRLAKHQLFEPILRCAHSCKNTTEKRDGQCFVFGVGVAVNSLEAAVILEELEKQLAQRLLIVG